MLIQSLTQEQLRNRTQPHFSGTCDLDVASQLLHQLLFQNQLYPEGVAGLQVEQARSQHGLPESVAPSL